MSLTTALAPMLKAEIAEISVAGFKSISKPETIEIRPVTILAGANSSGKSSMMQPLLLLKQTLEATYDPGPLLLNGPNVKFDKADELLSRIGDGGSLASFQMTVQLSTKQKLQIRFQKEQKHGFEIKHLEVSGKAQPIKLWPGMSQEEIIKTGIVDGRDPTHELPKQYKQGKWRIKQSRCFLEPEWVVSESSASKTSLGVPGGNPAAQWETIIPEVIHLPGFRGNPERRWPVTSRGPAYPGTFEKYTASVILRWMEENEANLGGLNLALQTLKLTSGVYAKRHYDVQVELYVGRLLDSPPNSPENQVNIADVGLGVSQILPVLVALEEAKPGQLVFVEDAESHLHPQAQFVLAQILTSAADRGVRVVVETHSSHLLLGVQTQVAEGKFQPDKVKLHWFQRRKDGHTIVRSADLDEAGRFGDWPQDFDDVALQTQKEYLDAAHERLMAAKNG